MFRTRRCTSLLAVLCLVGPILAAQEPEQVASPLHEAVRAGDVDQVRTLLTTVMDVDPRDWQNQTPLFAAAQNGHAEIARLLLQAGADPNVQDHYGTTALIFAAGRGHLEVVRALVDHGADLDHRGGRADATALMTAAELGRGAIAELLVVRGANPLLRDLEGWTAAELAAQHGHAALAARLETLATMAAPTPDDLEAFLAIARAGDTAAVRARLEQGADVNMRWEPRNEFAAPHTALTVAAGAGNTELVHLLLSYGADPATAVPFGEFDILSPLGEAVQHRHTVIARLLLEAGADANTTVNAFGWTTLMEAAADGEIGLTALLLEHGADTEARANTPESPGWTALMWAARTGQTNTVRLLLRYGADVDATSGDGLTPLRIAEQEGHAEVARLLREAGGGG